MNIAFFGSPESAALLLKELIKNNNPISQISYVVTQGDKPVGKHLKVTSSPVKKVALEHAIPIFDLPLKANLNLLKAQLYSHEIDLAIVYAYGVIIPGDILELPQYGFWNIHPSKLPLYRGPTPINHAIMMGDKEITVCLMMLDSGMDTGQLLMQMNYPISPTDTSNGLETRLAFEASRMIQQGLRLLQSGNINKTAQSNQHVTYTSLIKKDDGYIPLSTITKALQGHILSKDEYPSLLKKYITTYPDSIKFNTVKRYQIIYNYYRSLQPWPGIWTKVPTTKGEKRLKIVTVSQNGNKLVINKVQLEGKNPIDFTTFQRAYKILD